MQPYAACMVSTEQLLAFGVAALVLIAIPGPSVVFTVSRALAYGRGVALATVVGNSCGLMLVLALVSLGLGAVVQESVTVFLLLKVVGAAYLVLLGVQAIRHRHAVDVTVAEAAPLPRRRALRQGFVVGASNPKAFVIFAAVLPQFVDRTHGHVQAQMLLLGSLAFVIGLVSDSLWALLASRLRGWFNASPRRGRAMGTVGGTSMIGLGVALAVTGRPQ
jgi:threonine/homoserine/homoserine lactone efflux protein